MINLTSGTRTLDLPEASFGITYNRYNDVSIQKMVDHYTDSGILKNRFILFTVVKNPDLGVRNIRLTNIPISLMESVKEFLHLCRYDLTKSPITITHGSNIWVGSFVNKQVSFVMESESTFSISLEFVGKRTAGVL